MQDLSSMQPHNKNVKDLASIAIRSIQYCFELRPWRHSGIVVDDRSCLACGRGGE